MHAIHAAMTSYLLYLMMVPAGKGIFGNSALSMGYRGYLVLKQKS